MLLVRALSGPINLSVGDEAKWTVIRYNSGHPQPQDTEKVNWVIKFRSKEPKIYEHHGPELKITIPNDWDGEYIRVYPYMNSPAERVSWATQIGQPPSYDDVPWMSIAEEEIGVLEIPGPLDHPRIVAYHESTSMGARSDEVPWCSSFVNWCVENAGLEGSNSAWARSWLHWGRELDEPRYGAVVVFSRNNDPSQGHVAFYVGDAGNFIKVLGGNQSNSVCIQEYPKSRVLSYRWPA